MGYRAVIFDLGGVVLASPLHTIARYEREVGLPAGFVNRVVAGSGPSGAWSRLERGELAMEAFYRAFESDCERAGGRLDARRLFERIAAESAPRPAMIEAIRRVRAAGLSAAALTNNWNSERDGAGVLRPHFDAFIESCVVGLRKPDPRIYELVCQALRVAPSEAVFLDDIGANLKPARALGMETIKVEEPLAALDALQRLLEIPLLA